MARRECKIPAVGLTEGSDLSDTGAGNRIPSSLLIKLMYWRGGEKRREVEDVKE